MLLKLLLEIELPTTAFYTNMYNTLNHFCFDILCKDDPIIDDERLEGYNVKQKRDEFIQNIKQQVDF